MLSVRFIYVRLKNSTYFAATTRLSSVWRTNFLLLQINYSTGEITARPSDFQNVRYTWPLTGVSETKAPSSSPQENDGANTQVVCTKIVQRLVLSGGICLGIVSVGRRDREALTATVIDGSQCFSDCHAEKWRKQQEAVSRKADELAVQRIAEIAADVQVDYAGRVKDIAYHLADELEKTIKFMAQDGAIPAGELRKLIAAAKDLWSMSVNETVSDSGDTGVIELPRRNDHG